MDKGDFTEAMKIRKQVEDIFAPNKDPVLAN